MAKVIGPWNPNYPVDFKSNGDTSRAAFGKHIQEIERIYGLLSGLGAAKIEAEDLTNALGGYVTNSAFNNHVNSTNPHPNLQLATLGGSLGFDRISGSLGLDRTTGSLPSSRIDGLADVIRQNTVTEGEVSANGYAKFGNGLMIQWGKWTFEVDHSKEYIKTRNFPRPFPTQCFQVVLTTNVRLYEELENKDYSGVDAGVLTLTWNKNSCRTIFNAFSTEMDDIKEVYASFLAIGN